MLRAANKLIADRGQLGWLVTECLGGRLVFFDRYNLISYAMARLKARPLSQRVKTEEELRAMLMPGAKDHKNIVEGGAWWNHVRQWVAERDGEIEVVEALKAKDRALRETLSRGMRLLGR